MEEKTGRIDTLIKKAFKKYCITCCSYRQTNGSDECENINICKHAWLAGATWQREQLIKELREFIDDNDIIVDRDGRSVLIAKLDLLSEDKK